MDFKDNKTDSWLAILSNIIFNITHLMWYLTWRPIFQRIKSR